jgi:uncharacterized membrane protein YphA (DoxX/SURF4 family)
MKCPNCGAELVPGQKFCNKCGFPIEKYAKKAAAKNSDQNTPEPQLVDQSLGNAAQEHTDHPAQVSQVKEAAEENKVDQPQVNQQVQPGFQQTSNTVNQSVNQPSAPTGTAKNTNIQTNSQQSAKPNAFSFMIPFVKANRAITILSVVLLIIIALLNRTVAIVLLIVALVGWYFLADKYHDQKTSFEDQLHHSFSSVSKDESATVTDEMIRKIQITVIIAAAVSLIFLFVGNFVLINASELSSSDSDISSGLTQLGMSSAQFSFTVAISKIKSLLVMLVSGGTYLSELFGSSDETTQFINQLNAANTWLSIIEWVAVILPIVTIAFSFIKTKFSSIIRIVSSALSSIIFIALVMILNQMKTSGDSSVSSVAEIFSFGPSYYLALIGSIVALAASIWWLIRLGQDKKKAA